MSARYLRLSFFALAFSVASAPAQAPTTKLSGEIVASGKGEFRLKTVSGEMLDVKLSEQARLSLRSPADKSAIRPGAYLGTTAAPQPDGTLVASEVHLFAELLRGTGEGHRPMPNDPGNTMTNATVASVNAVAPRTTNATVAGVTTSSATDGLLRMTLQYKGGEKVVVVPDGAPIVMTEVGDRAMLLPGTHVVVYGVRQPDGTLLSERISIGKNAYAPMQ